MAPGRSHWVLTWMSFLSILVYVRATLVPAPCQDHTVYVEPSVTNVTVDYHYTPASVQTSVAIIAAEPPTNTSFGVGTAVVNVVYDDSGSNQTCTFNVTVEVLSNPDCPGIVMVESGPGVTSASATWPPANASYSDEFPILYTPLHGSSFLLGDTIVTAYATGYPNVQCTFTVSVVEDLSPPVFSDDFNVLTFNNSETPSWILTASDNSGAVTITSSPSPGSYFPLGNTSVTVMATDSAMLTSTETFTVQVVSDGSPETMNCPVNQLLNVAPNQVPLAVSWDEPIATSGTGTVTTTSDYNPDDLFNVGTTKVTYKFTDDAGRTSKCFFKIKITLNADKTAPEVVSCPQDVTVNEPAGTEQTPVTWNEPVFNDAVSGTDLDIQQSKMSGSNFTEGSTQVLYSAMDGNFNAAYCMFTVNVNVVEDNNNPVIVNCPQNITRWVPVGDTMATVLWVAPNITDDSPFTVQVSHEPGSVFMVGMDTTVSYTATDIVNNMADCTFIVSVREDTEDPVLDCPSNITMLVTQEVTSQVVTWPTPNATDNSGDVTITSSPPSGTPFIASVSGQNDMVTVMAADAYGNDVMCTFFVNVRYDVPPLLTCPDITQETVTGQATASVTWPDVVITDDYTPVSALMNTSTHGSMIDNMRYDADPITVTLTAEDEQGNIGTCTFTVDVVDLEKPVWSSCPPNITEMAEIGTNSKVVSWPQPTVVDNSGKDPIERNIPPTSQLFSGGIWPLVYTATDDSNNTGTCKFYVTVEVDGDVPVFDNCPSSPVTVNSDLNTNSAVANWGEITATDDSGAPTITSNYASGQRLDIGSYNIVYQARDINGNVATCRFNVMVIDREAPGFTSCPDSFSVPILNTQPSVRVNWDVPTFVDNSIQGSASATLSPGSSPPGSQLVPGSHDIAYIAMDASGNMVSTCSFTVTVMEQTDTIVLDGELLLDVVRGIDGQFSPTVDRIGLLRDDLDYLFRTSSSLAPNFVGIQIIGTAFNADSNFRSQFSLHLSNPSYYNEEEIKQAFYSALTDNVDFASSNTIVPGSFNLYVREFRGQFTLRRIVATSTTEVDFVSCCADPTSNQYTTLEGRINENLLFTFNGLDNFKMGKSLRYRDGSVVVPFTITLGEDSTATPGQADTDFTEAVNTPSLEWMSSELFLMGLSSPDVLPIEEFCPASFSCLNGGTCTVINATYVYDHGCSCPSGTSGDMCENTGIVLSTEAIIGISVGVLAFLLILLFICCCCFLFLTGPKSYRRDPEYGRKAAPLMLMPRDDFIYRRPPIMDRPGPVITEIEEGHEGPYFMHESEDYRAPDYRATDYRAPDYRAPAPLPLAIEPAPPVQIPRPVTLGPSFQHEYAGYVRSPRRGRSQRNRFRNMLPDRLPRAQRRADRGPRFQGDYETERVEDMKHRLFQEFNY